MLKIIGACTPVLLALTVAATTIEGQTPGATGSQQVTAVGCVTRNGSVDVNKGTRQLNMEPNGLALTEARLVREGGGRQSAVPGSQPEGTNSGTIPQGTIVTGRSDTADTASFALSGDQVQALGQQVGRRVEVVGRLAASGAGTEPRGTSGRSPQSSAVGGDGTREERPAEGLAHPSNELQKLEVISFRPATGVCQ